MLDLVSGELNDGTQQAKLGQQDPGRAQALQRHLRFAPATQGDETAYQSLYRDLVTYDTAVGQRATMSTMAANKPAEPAKQGFFQGVFGK